MAVSDRDTLMSAIFERMKEDSVLRDIATKPFFGAGGPVGTVPYESTANISATHSAERVVTAETILRIKELAEAGKRVKYDPTYEFPAYTFDNADDHTADIFRYKEFAFQNQWHKNTIISDNEGVITPERVPVKTERQKFYEDQEDAGAF